MFPLDVTVSIVAITPCCGTDLNLKPAVDPSDISKSFADLNLAIDIPPR